MIQVAFLTASALVDIEFPNQLFIAINPSEFKITQFEKIQFSRADFRRYYSQIRKSGFYFSNGELETNLAAIAVPLHQGEGEVIGALALVTSVNRMAVIDQTKLTPLIQRVASEISSRLN